MRIDTRVKLIEADFGGDDCNGEAFVQEYCHAGDCPSGKSLHTLYTSSGTEKINFLRDQHSIYNTNSLHQ